MDQSTVFQRQRRPARALMALEGTDRPEMALVATEPTLVLYVLLRTSSCSTMLVHVHEKLIIPIIIISSNKQTQ